jgi:hypothetical protein
LTGEHLDKKGELLAVENLMLSGVRSIAKILNVATFNHQGDNVVTKLNLNAQQVGVQYSDFEKYSFYVISVHYMPTLAVKFYSKSSKSVELLLSNSEILAKINLSKKNRDAQYPTIVVYKRDRMAKYEGLLALEGEYLEEEQYPNLNLEPIEGKYSDPLANMEIEFSFLRSEEVEFTKVEADLPSKYHIKCSLLEDGILDSTILDKTGKEIFRGPIDQGYLQKTTKYAITWPGTKSFNPFNDIRLTYAEQMFKKSKKGSIYFFKGHS